MADVDIELNLPVHLTIDEIATLLCAQIDDSDALEALVKIIDERVEQWDFTLALATHFEKLRLEFLEEFPENDEDEARVRGLLDEDTSDA
jgi:hypothetical protein